MYTNVFHSFSFVKTAEKEASLQDEKFREHQEKLEKELKQKKEELMDATFTEELCEEELSKLRVDQQRRRRDFETKRDQLVSQQKKAEGTFQKLKK